LQRAPYAALASRIQVRVHLKPVLERERFIQLHPTRLQSRRLRAHLARRLRPELLRQASQGLPRKPGASCKCALQMAAVKN